MSELQPTYEELFADLEQTVAQLERGDLPLDEALRQYERGVQLAAECQRLLDEAELRVQQLTNGKLEPWEEND